jgi:hypothetical protein
MKRWSAIGLVLIVLLPFVLALVARAIPPLIPPYTILPSSSLLWLGWAIAWAPFAVLAFCWFWAYKVAGWWEYGLYLAGLFLIPLGNQIRIGTDSGASSIPWGIGLTAVGVGCICAALVAGLRKVLACRQRHSQQERSAEGA